MNVPVGKIDISLFETADAYRNGLRVYDFDGHGDGVVDVNLYLPFNLPPPDIPWFHDVLLLNKQEGMTRAIHGSVI